MMEFMPFVLMAIFIAVEIMVVVRMEKRAARKRISKIAPFGISMMDCSPWERQRY